MNDRHRYREIDKPSDASKDETVQILIDIRITHNNELQLMDVLDQVMERYHGIGIGTPLVNDDETRRALTTFSEKWMPLK